MLTILSVSYHSKKLLLHNYDLVKTLNPNTPFQWVVVQNTPENQLEEDLPMDDPRFKMIKGPLLTQEERADSFYRSIHHAKALNLALDTIDTDFILTLDPDCFLLMPNWIELVTQKMQQEKLLFFGVPYPPKYFTHYRGFPNAICLFLYRQLIKEEKHFSLNFMPVLKKENPSPESFSDSNRLKSQCKQWIQHFLPFKVNTSFLKVKACHDTGYQIYERYRSLKKHQICQIFAKDERSFCMKLFESILPDKFRTFPRNTTFIRKASDPLFEEFGSNGEQFFWNDQLFGFHIKGVLDNLSKEVIDQFKEQSLQKIKDYLHYWQA